VCIILYHVLLAALSHIIPPHHTTIESQVQEGCEALVRAARQRWFDTKQGYVDDITAVVVALGEEEP
jgi:hypothetical protein